jgi:outer membrane receptor protein involved in Fe transport
MLFVLWGNTMAFAEGQAEDDLSTIYVTSDRTIFDNLPFTPEQTAETANTVIYDEAAIEASSANNLADFLAEKGIGLMKAPTDFDHSLLTFRGFRSDHLSKEMDGRMLFLINGHRTGTSNPTQVSLLNVERIEIIRGAQMFQYAGNTAAGIINVVTRKGGPEPLSGSLELGIASYDTYKGELKLNGAYSGLDYSLGYFYTKKGNYSDGEGATVYHSETQGVYSYSLELGYTFNDNHRIGFLANSYKVDKAYRPSYYDVDYDIVLGPSFTNRLNSSNTLSYSGRNSSGDMFWELAYTFGENYSKNYSVGENVYPMANRYVKNNIQGKVTYKGSFYTLIGGLDWLRYDTEEGASQRTPLLPTARMENYGAFLVGDLRFVEGKLVISGSLRYDHYTVDDKRVDPGDDPHNLFGGHPPIHRSFDNLAPSLGVSYLPWDYLKFRINYTRTFRIPSPRELFSASQEGYNFYGYPHNDGETTDSYEAGFDLNTRHISLSTSYFYSYTKGYVYQHSTPETPTRPWYVRNSERQIRSGIEFSLSGNLAGLMGYNSFELRPYFYFTHLFKHEEQFRRGVPDLPPGIAASPMNGMNSWTPIVGVVDTTIAYGVRFRHPSFKLLANLNVSRVLDFYAFSGYPEKTVGYTVVDFSLRKGLVDTPHGDLELKVDVNNLFNKYYKTQYSNAYYMPGRNFYLSLAYNF